MAIPVSTKFSEIITGYPLDEGQSWWGIVVPDATSNLIPNPALELHEAFTFNSTNPYTTNTCTIKTIYQNPVDFPLKARRGLPVAYVVPSATNSRVRCILSEIQNEGIYTLSMDVHPSRTSEFRMEFEQGAQGQKAFQNLGAKWHRLEFTIQQGSAFNEVGIQAVVNAPYWTGNWQLEKKPYSTTFAHGDNLGFYNNGAEYRWAGQRLRSHSIRTRDTRHGGRIVWFDKLGIKTVAAQGFSMNPFSMTDRTEHQRFNAAVMGDRTVALVLEMRGKSWRDLAGKKAEFTRLISPHLVADGQSLWLVHRTEQGELLYYACRYTGGFEGNVDNLYAERFTLKFEGSQDYLESEDTGIVRGFDFSDTTTTTPKTLYFRDYQKSWTGYTPALSVGNTLDGADPVIKAVALRGTGKIVVAGNIRSTLSGYRNVMEYDPATGNLLAFQFDKHPERQVNTLAVHPGKKNALFVGGKFNSWVDGAGAPNTTPPLPNYFGYTDGAGWYTVGSNDINDEVLCCAVHPSGDVYVGGKFTTPFAQRFGRYAGFNLAATVPTGTLSGVSQVDHIAIDNLGKVFLSGSFSAGVALYDPSTNQIDSSIFTSLGEAGTGLLDGVIHSLAADGWGRIYVSGTFSGRIARWTGVAWDKTIGYQFLAHYGESNFYEIHLLGADSEGFLNISVLTNPAGFTGRSFIVRYDGSRILPPDINTNRSTLWANRDKQNAFGLVPLGDTSMPYRRVETIDNAGAAPSKPTLLVVGSGIPTEVKCLNTGKAIRFRAGKTQPLFGVHYNTPSVLNVKPQESIVVDCRQPSVRAASLSLGDISNTLDASSDLYDFELLPGENKIAFCGGWEGMQSIYTATGGMYLLWQENHYGIEGGYE